MIDRAQLARGVRRFDAAVDAAVARVRGPILDHVCYPLSSAADHSLLWLAAGSIQSAISGDTRRLLRLSAALGIESFATNTVIKSAFRRVRPERPHIEGPLPYGMRVPITSSFPSGHATAAFTLVPFLADGGGRRGAWYGLATLVAVSRVYVGMHHASDVVAGAALGAAMGAVLHRTLPLSH